MEITDIRINLAEDRSAKLQGFATITLDGCFVIRDLKIISGTKGLFVAMPSRKLTARCPRCRCKNHLRAQYCNDCGARMRPHKTQLDERGRAKLHADIAHPINQACRDKIQSGVLDSFRQEIERSKQDGYKPPRDYYGDAGPEGSDDDYDDGSSGKSKSRTGKTDKVGKTDRTDKADKADKVDKPENPDKADKADKPDTADKGSTPEKSDRAAKPIPGSGDNPPEESGNDMGIFA